MTTTAPAPTSALVPTGTWAVDPTHSTAGFGVKHMGIANVRGEFTDFEGTLEIGDDISAAQVRGSVKVTSVDTGDEGRDGHLRSPDFFDVEAHPEMTFASTSIEAAGADSFRITGDLMLHGITNELVLNAEVAGTDADPWGNERVGIEITGQLSREDYGMKFNKALGSGNMLVGDKVKLALDVSAVRQA